MLKLVLVLLSTMPSLAFAGAISESAYQARVDGFAAAPRLTDAAGFLAALPLVGDCASAEDITGGRDAAIHRYALVGSAAEGSGRTHSRGFVWYWTPNADGYNGQPLSYIREVTMEQPVFSPLALQTNDDIGYEDTSLDIDQTRIAVRGAEGVWWVSYEHVTLGPDDSATTGVPRIKRVDTNVCLYTAHPGV